MPTLSVIIVNYNVRHFLTNCLDSIQKSRHPDFDLQVIVVDNNSADGSVHVIRQSYPWVTLIENKENLGFAKANNQGFAIAGGQYILSLNPDTILQEDTLALCWQYMEQHPDCGVLGVKMIDGSGNFLPESKRGLPSLWNAFCKFSGLATLFPDKPLFSGYYLGNLDPDATQEVDVLCGAFMFFRAKALMPLNGFDEDYFMYGEDIDLSVRMHGASWKVVYFPQTRIIHFKGESSKKASFNYILHFYQSMSIYVGKHYKGWYGWLMRSFIRFAILFTAIISFVRHNLLDKLRIFADAFLLMAVQTVLKKLWAIYYFNNPDYYSNFPSVIHTIGTSATWVFFLWFFGHYDKHWKPGRQWTGIVFATLAILIIYSLLPSDWRSSRFLILAGAVFALITTAFTRFLLISATRFFSGKNNRHSYIIIADFESAERIADAISVNEPNATIAGYLYPSPSTDYDAGKFIGDVAQIREIVALYHADNIVFSSDEMTMQHILDMMVHPDKEVRYLIAGSEASSVVGSESSSRQGLFFHAETSYRLSQGLYLRLKRGFDVSIAIIILIIIPFWLKRFQSNKKTYLNMAWEVLKGKLSWFTYMEEPTASEVAPLLPLIRPGVFAVSGLLMHPRIYPVLSDSHMVNQYYARNYSPFIDFHLLYEEIFLK